MSRHICIIPSWYPTPTFPYGIFVRDQVHALARQHQVDVVTPWMLNWREWLHFRTSATMESDRHVNTRTWRVSARQWPTLSRWLPFLSREAELKRFCNQFHQTARDAFASMLQHQRKPDVLHAHVVLPAGLAALRIGRDHRIPVVLTEHSGPFRTHLETDFQKQGVHEVLTGVDQVIAVSPSLRDDMKAAVPELDIQVVGNVISTDDFTPAATQTSRSRFRFFCAAVHHPEKGIQFLLEAAHLLRKHDVPSFEVVVGGDGPMRSQLECLVDRLNLGTMCRFVGMLTREQMRVEMQACDVFVLPSLGETFGVVAVEAMACGKPVLATRCGGPEFTVAPETGVLVPAKDSAALAQAMAELISRKVRFNPRQIRDSAIGRFGPDAFLHAMNAIYDSVLSRRPANYPILT